MTPINELASYVSTRDIWKAFMLYEGLGLGIVWISYINLTSAAAPFGGMKESGLGLEGASESLNEFKETSLGGVSIKGYEDCKVVLVGLIRRPPRYPGSRQKSHG